MIIVMAGLPKCGKTTVVKKFKSIRDDLIVFSPDFVLPEDLDAMSEDEQKSYRISAWGLCHDEAMAFCRRKSKDVAVFDTTGSNVQAVEGLKSLCIINDHKFIYLYVHDLKARCVARGMKAQIVDDYYGKMKRCFARFNDDVKIIKNVGTLEDLSTRAETCLLELLNGS